ncbi:MAG: hypothetical protein L0Z73_09345 [Gammaproteobacteria bacterium]|nr:hypothetical protein [Gammaproteobacteria bacterium]
MSQQNHLQILHPCAALLKAQYAPRSHIDKHTRKPSRHTRLALDPRWSITSARLNPTPATEPRGRGMVALRVRLLPCTVAGAPAGNRTRVAYS